MLGLVAFLSPQDSLVLHAHPTLEWFCFLEFAEFAYSELLSFERLLKI
jgi:hypothetical protein